MDESEVERQVELTRQSPEKLESVMSKMMVYRDPAGVYANGGCIDYTRDTTLFVLSVRLVNLFFVAQF
jgi:hypothetical protein